MLLIGSNQNDVRLVPSHNLPTLTSCSDAMTPDSIRQHSAMQSSSHVVMRPRRIDVEKMSVKLVEHHKDHITVAGSSACEDPCHSRAAAIMAIHRADDHRPERTRRCTKETSFYRRSHMPLCIRASTAPAPGWTRPARHCRVKPVEQLLHHDANRSRRMTGELYQCSVISRRSGITCINQLSAPTK